MNLLRTPEQQAKYDEYIAEGNLDKGCGLCERRSLRDFGRWRIIDNIFPYDRIAKVHHMIIPKRHVKEADLTYEELEELRQIKEEHLQGDYDLIIEATHRTRSIPGHFHIHLVVFKD